MCWGHGWPSLRVSARAHGGARWPPLSGPPAATGLAMQPTWHAPVITSPDEYVPVGQLHHEEYSPAGKPLTTSLDAGVPLRDVQEAASHSDPCTTMRYDRARASLDRGYIAHERVL